MPGTQNPALAEADAEHIAAIADPDVARALARLLEAAAVDVQAIDGANARTAEGPGGPAMTARRTSVTTP